VSRRVLITGASIAGNTTAWWLGRAGFAVTVVERAPAFRDGGQNVDVRGIGRTILREMGVTPLAGIGATLAITGARVLAGEMARGDDLPGAFAAYERAMRPMVEEAQGVPKLAPRLMHPRTRPGSACCTRACGRRARRRCATRRRSCSAGRGPSRICRATRAGGTGSRPDATRG
jgi:2-polyprenyl-6-methoxyphenol hydroxylase-like FAD-dependent oxidoreductase